MGKKSAKRSPKRTTSKRTTSKTKKTAKKQAPVKITEPVKCVIGFTAAAERWDVSDKTIQNWIKKGLPVSGTQRKRVFDVSECDAWVASYRDEKLISREEYELFAAECVIEARHQMLTRRRFTLRAFTKIDRVTVITQTLLSQGKSTG